MGPEEPRPGYQDLGLGEDPPALNSPLDHPQASWRSERRSRTTVRSAALPNSPTPTAWWPSGGQRTSIGEAGAPGPAGSARMGGGEGCWKSEAPAEGGLRLLIPVTTEITFLQCVRGRARRNHPCGARVHRRLPYHRSYVCG